jgi:hypothetical protein
MAKNGKINQEIASAMKEFYQLVPGSFKKILENESGHLIPEIFTKFEKVIKENPELGGKIEKHFDISKIDESALINKDLSLLGYDSPPYSIGTEVISFKSTKEINLVRVHTEKNILGRWTMKPEDIRGYSPRQIHEKFALPDLPTHFSEVTIPEGTNMRMGIAAPNFGNEGKGIQFEILEKIPTENFKNTKQLNQL